MGSGISVKRKLRTGTLHPKVNEIEESGYIFLDEE